MIHNMTPSGIGPHCADRLLPALAHTMRVDSSRQQKEVNEGADFSL